MVLDGQSIALDNMELTLHSTDASLVNEFLAMAKDSPHPEVASYDSSTDLTSPQVLSGIRGHLTAEQPSLLLCKGFMAFLGSETFKDPVGNIAEIRAFIIKRTTWYKNVHHHIDAIYAAEQAERDANRHNNDQEQDPELSATTEVSECQESPLRGLNVRNYYAFDESGDCQTHHINQEVVKSIAEINQ